MGECRYDDPHGQHDDCNDQDASIYPGAIDYWGDQLDTDCDGIDGVDFDEDGYADATYDGQDCDDSNANVYPGAPEFIGSIDYNCDGMESTDDTCFSSTSFANDKSISSLLSDEIANKLTSAPSSVLISPLILEAINSSTSYGISKPSCSALFINIAILVSKSGG